TTESGARRGFGNRRESHRTAPSSSNLQRSPPRNPDHVSWRTGLTACARIQSDARRARYSGPAALKAAFPLTGPQSSKSESSPHRHSMRSSSSVMSRTTQTQFSGAVLRVNSTPTIGIATGTPSERSARMPSPLHAGARPLSASTKTASAGRRTSTPSNHSPPESSIPRLLPMERQPSVAWVGHRDMHFFTSGAPRRRTRAHPEGRGSRIGHDDTEKPPGFTGGSESVAGAGLEPATSRL
ncbi:MAG: hypothetical protein K0R60_1666, partial [Microbacterium sp.]|nr:hypothetical protein [Microbacterium sp.]